MLPERVVVTCVSGVVLVVGMRQRGGVLSVHVVTCVCCVVLVTLAR